MVHAQLVDVVLQFRLHPVASTADVTKMYRVVQLAPEDRDLCRLVSQEFLDQKLQDFRMARATLEW